MHFWGPDSKTEGAAELIPLPHSEDDGFVDYERPHKVDEAVRIMSGIIISQEIERSGKSFDYYDAVGPNAHEIIVKKGVEVSNTSHFSYETFRTQGHFVVIAKALLKSSLNGKIIYESKTGKWVGTEDIRQEWLP